MYVEVSDSTFLMPHIDLEPLLWECVIHFMLYHNLEVLTSKPYYR